MFLLLVIPFLGFTQSAKFSKFKIEGNVNLGTGVIDIKMTEAKEFYPNNFKDFSVKIKDGKFLATGEIQYPIWLSFNIGGKYISERTVISQGVQCISLNIDSGGISLKNDNKIMSEENKYKLFLKDAMLKTELYRKHYDSLRIIYPNKFPYLVEYSSRKELKDSYVANDIAMLNFIKSNPDSYYGLFKLFDVVDFGFNNTLGMAYNSLSTLLKKSIYGEVLLKKINVAKQISVGAQLPELNVKDQSGEGFSIKKYSKNKYILIDLWYSHCSPCIAQFDNLKNIYAEFNSKGFEILAISTDKEKYVADWKSVIIKHKLPWPQYLDLNGLVAHGFNVKIYPSNLLLNQKREIIATDLSPVELKFFLEENLR